MFHSSSTYSIASVNSVLMFKSFIKVKDGELELRSENDAHITCNDQDSLAVFVQKCLGQIL